MLVSFSCLYYHPFALPPTPSLLLPTPRTVDTPLFPFFVCVCARMCYHCLYFVLLAPCWSLLCGHVLISSVFSGSLLLYRAPPLRFVSLTYVWDGPYAGAYFLSPLPYLVLFRPLFFVSLWVFSFVLLLLRHFLLQIEMLSFPSSHYQRTQGRRLLLSPLSPPLSPHCTRNACSIAKQVIDEKKENRQARCVRV